MKETIIQTPRNQNDYTTKNQIYRKPSNVRKIKKIKKLDMNKYKKNLHFSSLIFHLIYNVTLNFWNAQLTFQQK